MSRAPDFSFSFSLLQRSNAILWISFHFVVCYNQGMLNEKKKIRNSNQLNIQRVLATGYTWQGIITASFNLPRAPRTLATDFVHMIEILEPPSYSVQLALCKGTHQKIISHHCFPISSAPGKVDKLTISNSQSFFKKKKRNVLRCAVLFQPLLRAWHPLCLPACLPVVNLNCFPILFNPLCSLPFPSIASPH